MFTRNKFITIAMVFFSLKALAQDTLPEHQFIEATPIQVDVLLPVPNQAGKQVNVTFSKEELLSNPSLTEGLVNNAVETNNIPLLENVLEIYRTFSQQDPILVQFAEAKIAKSKQDYTKAIRLLQSILHQHPQLNPVRIELAINLFLDKQDNLAKTEFSHALAEPSTPKDIVQLIHQYLNALDDRSRWQWNVGANYVRERNVNKVSDAAQIEQTGFIKGEGMRPQKAHGVQFNVSFEKNINLLRNHYLHIENLSYGKVYWDNHDYDDITNRTYVGYMNQSALQTWSILPFYERQWYGGHRYKKAVGGRVEFNRWIASNWQLSGALEYSKAKYHENANLDGNNKLASLTLLWARKPTQFFYAGIDYSLERTQARNQAYDFKAFRLGWGQHWDYGISTRLSGSIAKRQYKDHLILGNVFRFDKAREDNIYSINATLWKRDWQIFGITPKLNFNWKKQDSNFDSLYSYKDRSVNLLVEKTF